MSKSTELVPTTGAGGAELAPLSEPTIASMYEEVSLSDIQLPKVYVQQKTSGFVEEGITEFGDVVMATGPDDPAPIELISESAGDSFTAYVIGREKFAATTAGGGIEFHPDKKRDLSDPDSWAGWFVDLAIPSHETMVPVRWMLWKSGATAAQQINTMLERKFHSGDTDPLCIRVTVRKKENKKGTWYAPVASPGEPEPEDLEIARKLRVMAAQLRAARGSENAAPEVSDQPAFS